MTTTKIQPAPPLKTTPIVSSTTAAETIRTIEKLEEPGTKMSRSETISSTVESHQSQSKSEQKFHMRLEHKTPSIALEPKTGEKALSRETMEVKKIAEPKMVEEKIENENVETSTIAKKDALSFFESMTRETEATPRGPKEMIKLVDDANGHEVKVGKLTKNY